VHRPACPGQSSAPGTTQSREACRSSSRRSRSPGRDGQLPSRCLDGPPSEPSISTPGSRNDPADASAAFGERVSSAVADGKARRPIVSVERWNRSRRIDHSARRRGTSLVHRHSKRPFLLGQEGPLSWCFLCCISGHPGQPEPSMGRWRRLAAGVTQAPTWAGVLLREMARGGCCRAGW